MTHVHITLILASLHIYSITLDTLVHWILIMHVRVCNHYVYGYSCFMYTYHSYTIYYYTKHRYSCSCIILYRHSVTLDTIVSFACITVIQTLFFHLLVSLLNEHSHIPNTVMSYRYLLQWILITPDTIITVTWVHLYSYPKCSCILVAWLIAPVTWITVIWIFMFVTWITIIWIFMYSC